MGLTIDLDENESAQVADEVIEIQPPDQVEFVTEGTLTITEGLLGEFEGTALKPAQILLSVDESQPVQVDLTEKSSLRLEEVDVGVETPDTDEISPGIGSLNPTTDDSAESSDIDRGAIAFTVEGVILDVPRETFEQLSEGELTLKSITFSLDDAVRSDDGSNDNVLLESSLLGYGIIIYRNGIIEIGTPGGVAGIGLP